MYIYIVPAQPKCHLSSVQGRLERSLNICKVPINDSSQTSQLATQKVYVSCVVEHGRRLHHQASSCSLIFARIKIISVIELGCEPFCGRSLLEASEYELIPQNSILRKDTPARNSCPSCRSFPSPELLNRGIFKIHMSRRCVLGTPKLSD